MWNLNLSENAMVSRVSSSQSSLSPAISSILFLLIQNSAVHGACLSGRGESGFDTAICD